MVLTRAGRATPSRSRSGSSGKPNAGRRDPSHPLTDRPTRQPHDGRPPPLPSPADDHPGRPTPAPTGSVPSTDPALATSTATPHPAPSARATATHPGRPPATRCPAPVSSVHPPAGGRPCTTRERMGAVGGDGQTDEHAHHAHARQLRSAAVDVHRRRDLRPRAHPIGHARRRHLVRRWCGSGRCRPAMVAPPTRGCEGRRG